MKHNDGEIIDLIYDGMPDAHIIKGHVSREVGLYVLELAGINHEYYYCGGVFGGQDYRVIFGDPIQSYARWVPDREIGSAILHICKTFPVLHICKNGRGAFPVTQFPIISRFIPVDCA